MTSVIWQKHLCMFHMGITKITQAKGSFIEFLNCGLKGDPYVPVCLSVSFLWPLSEHPGCCSEELWMCLRVLLLSRMFHKKSSFSRRFFETQIRVSLPAILLPLFIYGKYPFEEPGLSNVVVTSALSSVWDALPLFVFGNMLLFKSNKYVFCITDN